jgi:hypothetical protein
VALPPLAAPTGFFAPAGAPVPQRPRNLAKLAKRLKRQGFSLPFPKGGPGGFYKCLKIPLNPPLQRGTFATPNLTFPYKGGGNKNGARRTRWRRVGVIEKRREARRLPALRAALGGKRHQGRELGRATASKMVFSLHLAWGSIDIIIPL